MYGILIQRLGTTNYLRVAFRNENVNIKNVKREKSNMKKLWIAAAIACMSFTIAGCSKSDTNQEAKQEAAQTERVVATSVAVVEILDELGVEMVGVPTTTYQLPESVSDATPIGNPMTPDMEIIASLKPTVVIGVDTLGDDLKQSLSELGVETELITLSNYTGLKESIKTLANRFEVSKKADELLQKFSEKEKEMEAAVKGKESPDVLIIFGVGSSFMVASEDSYVGDMVKLAGGKNVMEDAPSAFMPVDMEYLAGKDPDLILFMCHANPEESLKGFKTEFETNSAWKNFTAVKEDKVVALDPNLFGMSASLTALDAMDEIVTILYGE